MFHCISIIYWLAYFAFNCQSMVRLRSKVSAIRAKVRKVCLMILKVRIRDALVFTCLRACSPVSAQEGFSTRGSDVSSQHFKSCGFSCPVYSQQAETLSRTQTSTHRYSFQWILLQLTHADSGFISPAGNFDWPQQLGHPQLSCPLLGPSYPSTPKEKERERDLKSDLTCTTCSLIIRRLYMCQSLIAFPLVVAIILIMFMFHFLILKLYCWYLGSTLYLQYVSTL